MRVQIVSFRCVLKNKLGQFISSSFNHEVLTAPSEGSVEPTSSMAANALPGLIAELNKLKKGQKKQVCLNADQAYGFYDLSLVSDVPRSQIMNGRHLKVGDYLRGSFAADGVTRMYRITSANARSLILDANHPLAGQDLVFDVEMIASRAASPADLLDDSFENKTGLPC